MERDKRILLVEPDIKMAEKFSQILRKEKLIVNINQRATEAIRSLQQEHFSALILDAGVKDMAWDEVVPIIKGLDPTLPIIMTSDYNTQELEANILHQHVFYYHVKTFGTEDLILAVRNAVEKSMTIG